MLCGVEQAGGAADGVDARAVWRGVCALVVLTTVLCVGIFL